MMSGDPSGLRVSDWKIAPPKPSNAPKTTAAIATGRRHSRTIRTWNSSPTPAIAWITRLSVIGKSPYVEDAVAENQPRIDINRETVRILMGSRNEKNLLRMVSELYP